MAKTVTYLTRNDIYKDKHKKLPLDKLKLKHFLINFNTLSISDSIIMVSIINNKPLKTFR